MFFLSALPFLRDLARSTCRIAATLCVAVSAFIPVAAHAQSAHASYTQGSIVGGGTTPGSVAVDGSGNVYNVSQGAVYKLTLANGAYTSSTVPLSSFTATTIAVDRTGNLYAIGTTQPNGYNALVKLTLANGTYTQTVLETQAPQVFTLQALATDTAGNLFVAEDSRSTIRIEEYAVGATSPTSLVTLSTQVTNLAVDANDNLFFSYVGQDGAISEVSRTNGTYSLSNYSIPITALCHSTGCSITGITADSAGNLYAAYVAGDLGGVERYLLQTSGSYTTGVLSNTLSGTSAPHSIAVSGSGTVLTTASSASTTTTSASTSVVTLSPPAVVNFGSFALLGRGGGSGSVVYFTLDTAVTYGSFSVASEGNASDFSINGSPICGSAICAAGTQYPAGTSVYINVNFYPSAVGARYGTLNLNSSTGVVATAFLQGTGTGERLTYSPTTRTAFPTGTAVTSPSAIVVDAAGSVYLGDPASGRVMKEVPNGSTSTETVIATSVSGLRNLALDGSGNVYFFRAVNSAWQLERWTTTNGGTSYASAGTALVTGLTNPQGLAVDASGNIFISDGTTNLLTELTYLGGSYLQRTVLSGLPAPAISDLSGPSNLAVDGSGNLYIGSRAAGQVLKSTLANGVYGAPVVIGQGVGTPRTVAVDGLGYVYVSDDSNNRVLRFPANGTLTTLSSGFTPTSIAVSSSGNVFVSESAAAKVEKITVDTPPALAFAATQVGTTSTDSPQTITIANTGNAALNFSPSSPDYTLSTGFSLATASTCPQAFSTSPFAAGASCTYLVNFAPTHAGSITGSLATSFTETLDTGVPVTLTDALSGTASATATVAVTSASIPYGTASTTLRATIAYVATAPTGAVTFTLNANTPTTAVCSAASGSRTCTATFNTGSYTPATYTIGVSEAADTNYAAASGTGTLTVTTATPTAAVPSVTAAYGTSPISLTANITYTGSTTPTGAVNFTVNQTAVPATCIGTTSPRTCTGSYAATGLAAASYPIQVTEAADTNYAAVSTSGTLTITAVAPTVNVTSTSVSYGTASTTLTASVAYTGSAAPTGSLALSVNGGTALAATCVGTASPRSCTATYNPSTLVPNRYTIQATQAADANYTAATASGTLTVATGTPTATVNSPTVAYGSSSTVLSAAFSYAGSTAPSGQVTFTVGNTPPVTATCTGTASPRNCTANYNPSALAATTYPIQVTQAADTNYAAVSASGTLTVSSTAPSINVSSTSVVYGATTSTLTASVAYNGSTAPTGQVSFTVNNGTPVTATCAGTASPRSCTATYNPSSLAAGSYNVLATQAADANYSAASASGSLTVSTATPAVTTASTSAAYGSTAVTLNASVAYTGSAAPTGAVTFTVNQTTLVPATCTGTTSPRTCTGTYNPSSLAAGAYPMQATQAADANYGAATSAAATLTVSTAGATINARPATLTFGTSSTTLLATVSYSGSTPPTGQVTLSVDGGAPIATTCSAAASALACSTSYNTAALAVGNHTLAASQAADANYTAITSTPATLAVTQATPTIAVAPASGTYGSATVTLTATLTYSPATAPTGAVTFQINGSVLPATCTGASSRTCTATYNTASVAGGSYSFTASIAADANYTAATSNQATFTVSMGSPTLTVNSPTFVYGVSPVAFTAQLAFTGSAAPTGAVTFLVDSATAVLAICSGTASPQTCTATYTGATLSGGNHTLTASQSASANYTAATSNTATITISPATPVLAVTSPTLAYGASPTTLTTTLSYAGPASPSGTVSFVIDGGTSVPAVCSGAASPRTCSASFSSSTLAVGSHTLSATLVADANYSAATSASGTITVNGAAPILSVVSVVAPYGTTNISLLATTTYAQATAPTGAVSFLIDNTTSVPAICSNSSSLRTCTANYNIAGLTVATHTLSAVQAADGNYLQVVSTPGTLIVNKGVPVVTAQPVSVPNGSASASLMATVSFTGPIAPTGGLTFAISGSAALPATCTGTTSPLNCTANLSLQGIPAGSYSFTAMEAADNNYAAASDTKPLTVAAQSATQFPVCTLGTIKSASSTSNAISITASCSDPAGQALTATINWGDGTPTVAANNNGVNTHNYGTPTSQVINTILLSATNTSGNTGTATQSVTVVPALAVAAGSSSTAVATSTSVQPANLAPVQVTFICTSISGSFSGSTVTNALPSAYGISCSSPAISSAVPSPVKVTISTTSSTTTAALWKPNACGPVLAGVLLPFCGMGLFALGGGANRRKRMASLVVLLLLLSWGMVGCGGSFKAPVVVTPAGTYYITVTELPSSGVIPTGFVQTSLIVPLVVNTP